MNTWYLDTEFVENGQTIELVSIGLVSFDGNTEYYAISSEWVTTARSGTAAAGDDWFQKNVTPKLYSFIPKGNPVCVRARTKIASDILELVGIAGGSATQGTPEFWADYASYDWVALCQLYGRMIDLPAGMPMFCMDLQQTLTEKRIRRSELPRQDPETEHNALADARHLRKMHRYTLGLNW